MYTYYKMTDTSNRDLEERETKEIENLEDDSPQLTTESEDVIPNAIVIKNIPFAIKREQLLDIIEEMGLPLPYAFNYHFDNGIFRGLAFANFTTPEDTLKVIQGLNGKDINGRKLKVEYKKLLPQHERERIEREKREKRGQLEEQHKNMSNLSLHSLNRVISNTNSNTLLTNNNNMNTAQPIINSTSTFANLTNPQLSNHFMGGPIQNNVLQQTQHHQQQLLVSQDTANSLYSNSNNVNSPTERYYAPLPSSNNVPIPPQQLDFNDPDTLEIYSQLLLFKDRERAYYELAYPAGLSANHKRIINVLCSFLNLMEVYDSRFVIIRRKNIPLNNSNGQGNVLDQINLQKHLQQVQPNYINQNSMLQPTSTGGSLNRSHSYTSLLQAHASSMSISLNNSNNNNNNNNNNVSNGNNNIPNTPKMPQGSQVLAQQSSGNISNTNTSNANISSSIYNNNNGSTNNLNGSSTYANSTTSPEPLQHPQPILSQQIQSTQQQTFIRQQATLTPSSRVPSGYSNHHQTMNISNPLLRNAAISPTTNITTTNTNSSMVNPITTSIGSTLVNINNNSTTNITNGNRLTSSLYNNPSSTNLLLNDSINKPLVPQNTNGSIHSNFSIQSYQDDTLFGNINGNGNIQSLNNRDNTNTNIPSAPNNADILYRTLSQSGALDSTDLDNHLAKSLSGLDVQDSKKNNIW